MNNIAAKAVAFGEVLRPSFKRYGKQILKNAKMLEKCFKEAGATILFGKTENHMLLINTVESFGLSGKIAEERLDAIGITVNKNMIPDDPQSPMDPSGIRIGVPAITTRGIGEKEVRQIALCMLEALGYDDEEFVRQQSGLHKEIIKLCKDFPVPKEFK
jgi:glycine hydroxymethyltransferase